MSTTSAKESQPRVEEAAPAEFSCEDVVAEIPDGYTCPISTEIMKDPVILADGHTYEREAIEKWFVENDTSPITNEKIEKEILIPNFNLKKAIAEWLSQQPTSLHP